MSVYNTNEANQDLTSALRLQNGRNRNRGGMGRALPAGRCWRVCCAASAHGSEMPSLPARLATLGTATADFPTMEAALPEAAHASGKILSEAAPSSGNILQTGGMWG